MRSRAEFEAVRALIAEGVNDCEIGRRTGISRSTIRTWRLEPGKGPSAERKLASNCPICGSGELNEGAYSYLLGLYLGDGCLSEVNKNLFKLRIALDVKYPKIIEECLGAITNVRGASGGKILRDGCYEVYSNWKHWACLFPQHGTGPKHHRPIVLEPWQLEITSAYIGLFLRGLIHSDGCRGTNTVTNRKGMRYSYPRYMFTNYSADIRGIFCDACDEYGVAWRQMNWKTISIARRSEVARMDLVVGPKY